MRQLKDLGVRPLLLTGDRLSSALRVAREVGIPEADTHAALLPEDKQRIILAQTWPDGEQPPGASGNAPGNAPGNASGNAKPTTLRNDLEGQLIPKLTRGPMEVGFVGDGLNDCPALASAHVGIVLQEVPPSLIIKHGR